MYEFWKIAGVGLSALFAKQTVSQEARAFESLIFRHRFFVSLAG
jgi:hypothetical protein